MLSRADVPLGALTTLGIGGPAGRLISVYDEAELVAALALPEVELVLGGGSNVVIADDGVPGTVVRVLTHGRTTRRDGDDLLIEVQAGESWDAVVDVTVSEGLAGLESLSGIPGLVGATPVQNVGAYGQDVSQTIEQVRAYDRRRGRVETLPAPACRFGYRRSAFKADPGRWVVLAVTYRLALSSLGTPLRYGELARTLGIPVGGRAPLADVRAAVLALRRGKGMVVDADDPDSRSVGSFFTNPTLTGVELAALEVRVRARLGEVAVPGHLDGALTKVSAAWLIERSGFDKGYGNGRVGLSGKHVLALVNRGGGSASELLAVARDVRAGVRECFGVVLVPEPVLVRVTL